jgi:beta-galactosidase/beta-glucuronidase
LATDGIFARSAIKSSSSDGLSAAATLTVSATLQNIMGSAQTADVTFDLFSAGGKAASGAARVPVPAAANASAPSASTTTLSIHIKGPVKLWSPAQPALYTLRTRVGSDEVNTTVGFRVTNWSATTGFSLNNIPSKIRGDSAISSSNPLTLPLSFI